MKSPNFGERRDGLRPELVVIHYTAMTSCEGAMRALCDPAREVSAHYLISRDGVTHTLVPEDMRAWHAGAGEWRGAGDINSRSIGIELDNDGVSPFSAPLMDALEPLLHGILQRWAIPAHGVIGHSDMAPGRKIDPGPRFDWQRLARQGMSVWPKAQACTLDPAAFERDARQFGYPNVAPDLLLATFRKRFRPWAKAGLDGYDCALMQDLAQRFGIDRDPSLA